MSFAIDIDDKELLKLNRAATTVAGELGGNSVRLIMGRAAQQVVKQHFSDLASDAQHHRTATRLGANRTGFYLDAADKTQDPHLEEGGVSVSVKKRGIAQRLFGGTITPTTKKWLTIPATAEAYGKRAPEIEGLKFVLFGPGKAALVMPGAKITQPSTGKTTELQGKVYFWLVKSVTQAADPSVIPTDAEILEPVVSNARSYLERLWSQQSKS